MKKDDRTIDIIRAHIHNLTLMKRPINKDYVRELMLQLPSDKLKVFFDHRNPAVKEVAREVQKMKIN